MYQRADRVERECKDGSRMSHIEPEERQGFAIALDDCPDELPAVPPALVVSD
jgi:hypothetical protein